MRRKIIGMLVCMLLIATIIPAVTSEKNTMMSLMFPTIREASMRDTWTEVQKLLASDGAAANNFGYAVSLDGDTMVIGAVWYDSMGAAYIFTRTGTIWTEQAKLLASDGSYSDYFGCSVSLDGDTVVIGARQDDSCRGSAYVFTRSGTSWTQQAKLIAFDATAYDLFGYSVSLDGDTAVIGAYEDDDMGESSGSAYVFTRSGTTWTQEGKLVASDGAAGDAFGFSVSLNGDTAFIGAAGDETYRGSAYVFTRSGTSWTQQAKLVASDGAADDYFAYSVSLDGDTAFIGAAGDETYRGSAYVFTRSGTTWTQEGKLVASDGAADDYFGYSVSLDGDTAFIGAAYDDTYRGSAYVFTRTGISWTQQVKLLASDGAAGDAFGYSVSLDGDTAVIGAYEDDDMGDRSGSAYVFIKEEGNHPPNPPTITGPASGKIKVAIAYNFTTIDPDGNEVSYYIDWGDNTNSGWIGPYISGDVITKSHTWTKKGDYTIKAKAKDSNGAESTWGELSVTMPCSYNLPLQWFWERLFQRFPNALPILRNLMGY